MLSAVWELTNAYSQNSMVEKLFMLLSLCVISIPASMATFFTSSSCKDSGDWGKRLTNIHRMSHPVQDAQILSADVSIYEDLQWTQISSQSVPI